jgi:hypothetical protein
MQIDIWGLTDAEQQLRDSGALPQKTLDRISPLVEEEQRKSIQSDRSIKPDNLREKLSKRLSVQSCFLPAKV